MLWVRNINVCQKRCLERLRICAELSLADCIGPPLRARCEAKHKSDAFLERFDPDQKNFGFATCATPSGIFLGGTVMVPVGFHADFGRPVWSAMRSTQGLALSR